MRKIPGAFRFKNAADGKYHIPARYVFLSFARRSDALGSGDPNLNKARLRVCKGKTTLLMSTFKGSYGT